MGLIGLIKEIYSYIKDKIPAFDNVYNRALRRWTNNSSLRRKFSDNALSDFKKLVGYIENSSSVNPGLLEFFELLFGKKASLETLLSISKVLNSTLNELLTGNQIPLDTDYNSEIGELMSCCNHYERRLMFEIMRTVRDVLIQNRANQGSE